MTNENTHEKVLSSAIDKANDIIQELDSLQAIEKYKKRNTVFGHLIKTIKDDQIISTDYNIAQAVSTIVSNFKQNKYLFSMLITGLVEKIVNPPQDITLTQAPPRMKGGYSNRNTDESFITPILKTYGLTAMAKSGAESGRNFERPEPHNLRFSGNPRGKGNKEAYLGIIHAVQEENVDPFPIIVLLCTLDLNIKTLEEVGEARLISGLSIDQIAKAITQHHQIAKGNGKARLPVLAIQAIYQCLVKEMVRYKGKKVRNPPNRHTANDKDGWIGDIQVDNEDGTPFEGVEVKSEQPITVDIVRSVIRKVKSKEVNRYYILSTKDVYIDPKKKDEVYNMVEQVTQKTGCQVIANGLNRSLWYYLRLLENPNDFLNFYTKQVNEDADVKSDHRQIWYSILRDLNTPDEKVL